MSTDPQTQIDELRRAVARLEERIDRWEAGAVPDASVPEQLAGTAMAWVIASGCRSKILRLPEPVLDELAQRLIRSRAGERPDVLTWLDRQVPGGVPKSNFYRFTARFDAARKLLLSPLVALAEQRLGGDG